MVCVVDKSILVDLQAKHIVYWQWNWDSKAKSSPAIFSALLSSRWIINAFSEDKGLNAIILNHGNICEFKTAQHRQVQFRTQVVSQDYFSEGLILRLLRLNWHRIDWLIAWFAMPNWIETMSFCYKKSIIWVQGSTWKVMDVSSLGKIAKIQLFLHQRKKLGSLEWKFQKSWCIYRKLCVKTMEKVVARIHILMF